MVLQGSNDKKIEDLLDPILHCSKYHCELRNSVLTLRTQWHSIVKNRILQNLNARKFKKTCFCLISTSESYCSPVVKYLSYNKFFPIHEI